MSNIFTFGLYYISELLILIDEILVKSSVYFLESDGFALLSLINGIALGFFSDFLYISLFYYLFVGIH